MTSGVVREWHDEEGWGVLDSDETPGGCWAHFSALRLAGFRAAAVGQLVDFTFERGDQDGFDFRALDVTIEGAPPLEPEDQPPGTAYLSHLTIEWD